MKRKQSFLRLDLLVFVLGMLFLCSTAALGDTIHVPKDQTTIQAGIDATSDGDTVLVADGTYTGEGNKNLDFKGKAITVQSENGPANSIIDCEGNGRGFYFHSAEGSASVVDGFTIINGNADYVNGGGIYCDNSSPTITNCVISGNSADYADGGGVFCDNYASPTITNCTISGNSADYLPDESDGGGIYCDNSSSPTITDCTISGNLANAGGGISVDRFSSPSITNCVISGNSANGNGGGIGCYDYALPTITNCTISGNTASSDGGGLSSYDGASPNMTNCIFWENEAPINPEISGDSSPDVTYSNIQGGFPGTGNIDADPLFEDPENGDYHLAADSPCIDAGTSEGAPDDDLDGNPRPQGAGYDMGAYEYLGAQTVTGNLVTSDLWIRAVINTEEKGPIEAVWKKGGEDTTSRGDRVIWGHFYASPNDVTWGSENNPDLFVKIWFDVSGRVDVNYFHVSVPDIEVYSDYPYDGTTDEQGSTTMSRRYIRQYYEGGQSYSEENYEDGNPPSGYSPSGNPSGYSTINDLRIGSMINTVEKGSIDAVWRLGGQDTTSRGDQVVWGHFYASPSDVTWGSQDNPDLFVKIWFDVSGRVDVNYFHVSVPDIEVYADLPNDSIYDQKGTSIMDNRYIRHEYWR